MKQFIYLIRREFKIFLKNDTLRNVFILAPIFYGILLGLTYQKGKVDHLPIIVIDQDQSPTSAQVIQMLQDNKTIDILVYTEEPQNIKDELIKKNAVAVVTIPSRFEADVLQKKHPELNVYLNTSNVLTANFASKALQTTLGTLSAGIEMKTFQRKGMSAELAKTQIEPFKTNYITLFNTSSNYLVFMWPAMMAVVLHQVILLAMAVSFAAEFERGNFIKDFAGKHKYAVLVMLVKCLPIFTFSIVNVLIFYAMQMYFNIPLPENIFNFAIITSVFVAAATFLGIFFSILMPNALKATQILMVMASPAFIISGFTWPTSAMPFAIRLFTDIIPLTPFLSAFKILLIEKGDFYLVIPYLKHLTILMIVYFVLGWIALKIKIKMLYKEFQLEEDYDDHKFD